MKIVMTEKELSGRLSFVAGEIASYASRPLQSSIGVITTDILLFLQEYFPEANLWTPHKKLSDPGAKIDRVIALNSDSGKMKEKMNKELSKAEVDKLFSLEKQDEDEMIKAMDEKTMRLARANVGLEDPYKFSTEVIRLVRLKNAKYLVDTIYKGLSPIVTIDDRETRLKLWNNFVRGASKGLKKLEMG